MAAPEAPTATSLPLESSYARLPEELYARVAPTPVAEPGLLRVNRPLAERLGLDPDFLESPEGVEVLAGNRVPEGAQPLAMAYAGHQFGSFVPSLGDGRAVLLGEVVDEDGVRRDLHLKGSGRTPFSRMGDGRAGLGPVLREYIVSEGMAGLGIPTTRALAMVTTGETVHRPQSVEPGAVLTRVAASHVRVGTFEYFARRGRMDLVRALADHVIERLLPDAAGAPNPYPYRALLDEVIRRQADLVACWMLAGFVHGVMNTDNTQLAGETIDYGPCAFLDSYEPGAVYSSIDHGGRYAYDQQPRVALWNLARFAETLLPLLAEGQDEAVEAANGALEAYPPRYEASYRAGLLRKLGLAEEREGDLDLARDLLERMATHHADFTLTFRRLSDVSAEDTATHEELRALFADPEAFDTWAQRWRERLAAEGRDDAERRRAMRAANPRFIPRNHRVQEAIDAANRGDLGPLDELLTVVASPYDDHPELAAYEHPPEPHERVRQTFCGT